MNGIHTESPGQETPPLLQADLLFFYSAHQIYNTNDYLIEVDYCRLAKCKEECLFIDNVMCDEDVFELCNIIVEENEMQMRRDPFEGMTLYF